MKNIDVWKCQLVKDNTLAYEPQINCAKTAVELVRKFSDNLAEEGVWMIALNKRGNMIGLHEVAHGGPSECIVSPQAIFKRALLNNASAIILAHNHPSGSSDPSDEDRNVTQRIVKCGKILGIHLLDHIIVADETWYSFRENVGIA